jgi:site-specific DNA-methyltransferase (adenine-specific)
MAPGLVTAEKAARGKLPTDVWWHTIVSPTGKEKTGYPTQKPEGVLRRVVQASSRPGDWCLDPFAGSGTLGAVCAQLERRFVLVDSQPEAVAIARERLARFCRPEARVPAARGRDQRARAARR